MRLVTFVRWHSGAKLDQIDINPEHVKFITELKETECVLHLTDRDEIHVQVSRERASEMLRAF